jgi:hypothetical protein
MDLACHLGFAICFHHPAPVLFFNSPDLKRHCFNQRELAPPELKRKAI